MHAAWDLQQVLLFISSSHSQRHTLTLEFSTMLKHIHIAAFLNVFTHYSLKYLCFSHSASLECSIWLFINQKRVAGDFAKPGGAKQCFWGITATLSFHTTRSYSNLISLLKRFWIVSCYTVIFTITPKKRKGFRISVSSQYLLCAMSLSNP